MKSFKKNNTELKKLLLLIFEEKKTFLFEFKNLLVKKYNRGIY